VTGEDMTPDTYRKQVNCPNCATVEAVEIPRGTRIQGYQHRCSTCGVLMRLRKGVVLNDWPCADERESWWSFVRDFFGLPQRGPR
jgi:predicted RNA-binding Zn-ribbon protein involved in translation (DUF1610 family)